MDDFTEANRRPAALQSLWLVGLFLVGSFAPLTIWVVTGEKDGTVYMEQRAEAPAPVLALEREALREFPDAADRWFADRFPLRHELIRTYSAVLWFGLEMSAARGMLRGKEDWLFYRGERTLNIYRGNLLTDGQVEQWVQRYVDWRDWLAARDVEYVLLIAPEKQAVYPEYLPDWTLTDAEFTRTDQVVAALRERGLRVIDTQAAILDAKATEPTGRELYYPFGTHWNDLGAFVAYRELMAELSHVVPVPAILGREHYRTFDPRTRAADWTGDSWTVHMHLGDVIKQSALDLEPTFNVAWAPTVFWMADSGSSDGVCRNFDQSLPRAVFLRDSFGEWLWKFIANHFSRVVSESWIRLDAELIEREAPDVAISCRVERLFSRPLTHLGVGAGELAEARRWNAAEPLAEFESSPRPQTPEEMQADVDLEYEALSGPLAIDGSGAASLLLRFERPVSWDRDTRASARSWQGTLIDANGKRHRLDVRFDEARRWSFAGPVDVALPAALEFQPGAEALIGVALRRRP